MRRTVISSFNLYKGGSLSIYQAIVGCLRASDNVVEIATVDQAKLCSLPMRGVRLRYPLNHINGIYRVFIEQVIVPLVGYFLRADKLIMMGNFPALLWMGKQSVFFHNTLYLERDTARVSKESKRWWLEKQLFTFLMRVKRPKILVQTAATAAMLMDRYPNVAKRVEEIGVPENGHYKRKPSGEPAPEVITLFYPALLYPHKNHDLLLDLATWLAGRRIRIELTIKDPVEGERHPEARETYSFLGELTLDQVYEAYDRASALIFLSSTESLGIPLLEAVEIGLPIIAPNLPYVNAAIRDYYAFDLSSRSSLLDAIAACASDLRAGSPRVPRSSLLHSPSEFVDSLLS